MITINVKVEGGRGYDILLGFDTIRNIGKYVKRLHLGERIFIITSPKIGGFHLNPLVKSLRRYGLRDIRVAKVPDGEKHKSVGNHIKLSKQVRDFEKSNDGKKVFIILLGGGVVGDLGGYVAATYRRGTNYIQVPTSLLAFVDCGIGGKVGVDFEGTKNLLGAFHQPKLVYADLNLLRTLDKRELRSGLAEVVKYGVIKDPALFRFVESDIANVFSLDKKTLDKISSTSYRIKAAIVKADEYDEKGIRVILNYGHTIGHAVEAASKYAYRHGESVSIGMVCANDIAVRLGILEENVAGRVELLLRKIGLPVEIKNCSLAEIMRHFWHDKKFVNGVNKFVFATRIGKTIIRENIPVRTVKEVIKKRFKSSA